MTERFNVSGALLVKLFGTPDARAAGVRGQGRAGARPRRHVEPLQRLLLLVDVPARRRSRPRWSTAGAACSRSKARSTSARSSRSPPTSQRLYGPLNQLSSVQIDVMTALVSFDRVFEVLDLEPMIDDKPGAVDVPAGPGRDPVRPRRLPLSRAPTRCRSRRSSRSRCSTRRRTTRCCPTSRSPSSRASSSRWSGHSGAGKTTISNLVPRLYDVQSRRDPHQRRRRARRHAGVDARHHRRRHPGRPPVPRHHPRQPRVRAGRTPPTPRCATRCAAAQILPLIDALPDGLDTVVGDRGYRFSGGEKQRIAIARLLLQGARDRRARRSHRAPRLRVGGARSRLRSTTALAGRTSIVIAHRLSTVRHADKILVVVARHHRRDGTHDELLGRGGVYADLYETQFKRQATLEELSATP